MAGRIRSFEIAGYDLRVRNAFSTRRKEMEAHMDEKGWDYSQAAAQIAALATRKRKAEPLHAMLRTIWAARAEELGEVPVVHRSRGRVSLPAVPSALKIAWQAMRHLEERQSVFAAHQLEALVTGSFAGAAYAGDGTRSDLMSGPGRASGRGPVSAHGPGVRDRPCLEGGARSDFRDEDRRRGRHGACPRKGGCGASRGRGPHGRPGRGGPHDPADAGPDRRRAGPGRNRQDHDAAPCARACGRSGS